MISKFDSQKRLNNMHQSWDEESQQPVQSQVYLRALFPAPFVIPFIIPALFAAFRPLSMTRTPFISERVDSIPEDWLFYGRNRTKPKDQPLRKQLGKRCVPLCFTGRRLLVRNLYRCHELRHSVNTLIWRERSPDKKTKTSDCHD